MVNLTVIQSVYNRNPYIEESTRLNIFALESAKIDYELVIFNDHGDCLIKDDLGDILHNPRVKYIYSDINYGKKMCAGGWIGGIKYMSGRLIHFANQDDVYTPMFYELSVKEHEDPTLMLTHTNAFMVNEDLTVKSLMLNPSFTPDYYNFPFECFKSWFGVGEHGVDEVVRANNNILAPSVIYKKELHDLIGLPDIENCCGAADFEYWARILFNGYRCKLINIPLWLYRSSDHSTSAKVIDGIPMDDMIKIWVNKIKEKYYKLYKERVTKQ